MIPLALAHYHDGMIWSYVNVIVRLVTRCHLILQLSNVPRIETIDQYSEYSVLSSGSRQSGQFYQAVSENDESFIHPGFSCMQWVKDKVDTGEPVNTKLANSCPCTLGHLRIQGSQYTVVSNSQASRWQQLSLTHV